MTDNLPTDPETPTPLSKQDLFISHLYSSPNVKTAALRAGYAESTASSVVYNLLKKPEFQTRLREYAIQNDLMALPYLAKIEESCLKIVEADPEKYPKFKEIFRQKKQIAGILAQDTTPALPTINIKSIEHLQVILGDQASRRTLTLNKPGKAQDTAIDVQPIDE